MAQRLFNSRESGQWLNDAHQRIEEEAKLMREKNEALNKKGQELLTAPELYNAFKNIDAATGNQIGAIVHKKSLIIESIEKNLFNQEILANYPTVYLGSGIDFEYPLCLGAKKIILSDPILSEQDTITKIKNRILLIGINNLIEQTDKDFEFNIGNKSFNIKLSPEYFSHNTGHDVDLTGINDFISNRQIGKMAKNSTEEPPKNLTTEKKHQYTSLSLPEQVGMALTFCPQYINVATPELTDKIVKGGYVFADDVMKHISKDLKFWEDKGFVPIKIDDDCCLAFRKK